MFAERRVIHLDETKEGFFSEGEHLPFDLVGIFKINAAVKRTLKVEAVQLVYFFRMRGIALGLAKKSQFHGVKFIIIRQRFGKNEQRLERIHAFGHLLDLFIKFDDLIGFTLKECGRVDLLAKGALSHRQAVRGFLDLGTKRKKPLIGPLPKMARAIKNSE